ncbi:MAG TPA: hypoxanthine phosphoribosyltransferase [Phycisphaerales bacterium]|nr:hypoxanthine phosphoribosyltransferase [Phycisphaerales bacterium]
MLTDIERVLLDRHQIARRISELGMEIRRDLDGLEPDAQIVLVPILTGSIIFMADLMRELPVKMRISVVTTSSYPGNATASVGAQLIGSLPPDLQDKHVLIVDDILDSGNTIRLIRTEIQQRKPRSLRVCVLLRKKIPSALATPCDYVGFDIPDEFVVGYGLDYDNYYRNLPDVCTLRKEVM